MKKLVSLVALGLFSSLITAQEAAPDFDKAKLSAAARLPTVSVMAGIGFNSDDGIVLMGEVKDYAGEAATLEKALKGDDSDAGRYARLAYLYGKLNDKKKAVATGEKAVEMYRRRLKENPNDGKLTAEFAQSLDLDKNDAEADAASQRAIKLAPKEWFCHTSRGNYLTGRALRTLLHRYCDLTALIQVIAERKVAAADLDKSRRDFVEAMKCLDEAVRLAPNEPEVYLSRGQCRLVHGFFDAGVQIMEGNQINPMLIVMSDACLFDIKRLAELRPDDPRTVGIAALFEVLAVVMKSPEKLKGFEDIASTMPADTRKSAEARMAQLQKIAGGKDIKNAVIAEEVLGLMDFIAFGNRKKSEEHFRRVIALDPKCEQGWDMLAALVAMGEQKTELVALCAERLKHTDNAHTRFYLARAYEDDKQYDKAEEQVRLGLKKDPDDPQCNLAIVAFLLRRGDAASLADASKQLELCTNLVGASAPQQLRDDLVVIRSIHTGLTGKPVRAKEMLEELLQRDKSNRKAKDARAALGS